MTSALYTYYPYKPVIDKNGEVTPSSIHPKSAEIVLAFFTTAIPATIFSPKNRPLTWATGLGVLGTISYLFWSTLGETIPQKIADQICIQAFFTQDTIEDGMAKRVLAKSLQDQIYTQLKAIANPEERNTRLYNYFLALYNNTDSHEQKNLLFVKAVESSCCLFLDYLGTIKKPEFLEFITIEERFDIWKLAKNGPVVQSLKRIWDIEEKHNGKTILETYAAEAIQKQDNQQECSKIITNMNILADNGAKSVELDNNTYKIKENSALSRLVSSPSVKHRKAEFSLNKYLTN
jgi:hypothetical protein